MYGIIGNCVLNRIEFMGLSEWKVKRTDERRDLGAYDDAIAGESWPGSGLWSAPAGNGILAVTSLEWDISAKCKCKDGKWFLNYGKIEVTPVVRYRSKYSSTATLHWVREAESDHVADIRWWTKNEGKQVADAYEKSHYGDSYTDRSACESAHKSGLEGVLSSSALKLIQNTKADYDFTGKHTLPPSLNP